ncbi:MAG TPA: hypothetical protein VIG25_04670 [Pyrinomonadaceae bacterium]
MLLFLRRWRTLVGLIAGSLVLGLISVGVVGRAGLGKYFGMVKGFARMKSQGQPTWLEVDMFSFLLPMVGSRMAVGVLLVMAAVVFAFLVKAW